MTNRVSNILWGIVFIIAGVGLAGNVFDLWNFNIFFDGWWTLFIIVPCLISIIQNGFQTGSVIGLGIGGAFLLSCYDIIQLDILLKLIVPVLLIVIGAKFIFKKQYNYNDTNNSGADAYEESHNFKRSKWDGNKEYAAIFSGCKFDVNGDFDGCKLNAVFGGFELNLYNAVIKHDVTIPVICVFGGVGIKLPPNVKVKVSCVPVFGGVDNRYIGSNDINAPTVHIKGSCIFGGIDIK